MPVYINYAYHYFIDRFRGEISRPIVHIIDETIGEAARISPQGAWLTATLGTMKTGIYKKLQVNDYSAVLERKYGKKGTQERAKFDEEAYAFYTSQILLNARKEAHVTQSELAGRINSTKSYISRIENGAMIPSVAMFYRIVNALGMRVDVVRTI